VKNGAHDLSPLGPFLPFGKSHAITKDPDSVLNKEPLLDIVFITQPELFKQLWVHQDDKYPVQPVGDQRPRIRICVICDFGEVVLITFLLKRLFGQVEGSDQWDEGEGVDMGEGFKRSHPHVGFVGIFDEQVEEVRYGDNE
jgi:hypothetical protein